VIIGHTADCSGMSVSSAKSPDAVVTAHLFGAESDLIVGGLLGFSPVLTAVALGATFHRPSLRVAAPMLQYPDLLPGAVFQYAAVAMPLACAQPILQDFKRLGQAILGSRPCERAAGQLAGQRPIRFQRPGEGLLQIGPVGREILLAGLRPEQVGHSERVIARPSIAVAAQGGSFADQRRNQKLRTVFVQRRKHTSPDEPGHGVARFLRLGVGRAHGHIEGEAGWRTSAHGRQEALRGALQVADGVR